MVVSVMFGMAFLPSPLSTDPFQSVRGENALQEAAFVVTQVRVEDPPGLTLSGSAVNWRSTSGGASVSSGSARKAQPGSGFVGLMLE